MQARREGHARTAATNHSDLHMMGGLLMMVGLASAAPATKLIIDTDMSTDCDDVGALCIAHALEQRGEAELLAVVHDTGVSSGVGAVSSINHYYGRDDLLVGGYKGEYDKTVHGSYIDDLVAKFPAAVTNLSQVPDAVEVYRRALAAAPDTSVWISSIGFTTNIEMLLKSESDDISPMNGTELVQAKVKGIAWMGGAYPASVAPNPNPEHNFGYHGIGPSTAFSVNNWPRSVPIVFLGWEVGNKIQTGGVMTKGTPSNNPCRQAYIDHSGAGNDRSSWVSFAARALHTEAQSGPFSEAPVPRLLKH
jgi:inosine-uridine nucleoside N-ribohydrolase